MNIDIYNKDAWEFLEFLQPRSVDLILTDPMYQAPFYLEKLERVCRGSIVVFCQPENEFFVPDERAYWIKTPSTKNYTKRLGRFVEHILIKKGEFFNTSLHWSNYIGVYDDKIEEAKSHEFQKPLSLIERFVRIYSRPGDLILDPFMGSGTTLVAAKRLGRNAVGVDIKEECCDVAKNRLEFL